MKKTASWILIICLLLPAPARVSAATEPVPSATHDRAITEEATRKEGEAAEKEKKPEEIEPDLMGVKENPICSETETSQASTLLRSLTETVNPTRTEDVYDNTGLAFEGGMSAPDVKVGTREVVEKDKKQSKLSLRFDEIASELLSWALKCRAARGVAAKKPPWIEESLVKYLKTDLPYLLTGLRIDPKSADKGIEYTSILAKSEFRETVLFLRQLGQTYEQIIKQSFANPKLAVALAEQLDEYKTARKEKRDPKVTPKLKKIAVDFFETAKAAQKDPAEQDKLTQESAFLAGILLSTNPFNEAVQEERREPPLFDTIFGIYLGASYRNLLALGEKGESSGGSAFNWADMPLKNEISKNKERSNADELAFVKDPGKNHELRNSLRSARGHSPGWEAAPFWGTSTQVLADNLGTLSLDEREKLRTWIRDKVGAIDSGKTTVSDPLVRESLLQMARLLDSRFDSKAKQGDLGERVSLRRPQYKEYVATFAAEARTAALPEHAAAMENLDRVRKAYETSTGQNISIDTRRRFLELPISERKALTQWAHKAATDEGQKELLKTLLANPNRTEIIQASTNNPSLRRELYSTLASEVGPQLGDWSADEKSKFNSVLNYLSTPPTSSGSDALGHGSHQAYHDNVSSIRKKLAREVVALNDAAKKDHSLRAAADAAAVLYNRMSEVGLNKEQLNQLDIQGYDENNEEILEDHYSSALTADSIKANRKGLFSDKLLEDFIKELYGSNALIPDSTRRIFQELMKPEHELHRVMLRRIRDIVKVRKTLATENKKGKPRPSTPDELYRNLLTRPTPDLIESTLHKLSEDAFRMYADVQQYQGLRYDLNRKIKENPRNFSPTHITRDAFYQLAKWGRAQEAALTGNPLDHVISDLEVAAGAKADLLGVQQMAEALKEAESLDKEQQEELAYVENAMKLAGLGNVKGAAEIAEKLKTLIHTKGKEPLSEAEMRLVMLLNREMGSSLNDHYSEFSRKVAQEVLAEDKTEAGANRALQIMGSQFRALVEPITDDKKTDILERLLFNQGIQEKLAGSLESFEQQGLTRNLYKKLKPNIETLSEGINGYFNQRLLLAELEIKKATNQFDSVLEELFEYKYGHRRGKDELDSSLAQQYYQESRSKTPGELKQSSARADNWITALSNVEARVEAALNKTQAKENDKSQLVALRGQFSPSSDNAAFWQVEPRLRQIPVFFNERDPKARAEMLAELFPQLQEGEEAPPFYGHLKIIESAMRHSNGKRLEDVFRNLASELANHDIHQLETKPGGGPVSKEIREQIKKGYLDLVTSTQKNEQLVAERRAKRDALIEKTVEERFADALRLEESEESKEGLREEVREALTEELTDRGQLQEHLSVYGRGMQNPMDVSQSIQNESGNNLSKNYHAKTKFLLKQALTHASPTTRVSVENANQRLKNSFSEAAEQRNKKDQAFLEAKKKWEAIGGDFDGLSAVIWNHTDLSLATTPFDKIRGAREASAACEPPDEKLMVTSRAYIMKCAGWKFGTNGSEEAGNHQLQDVMKGFVDAGADLRLDVPGLKNIYSKDPKGFLRNIARNLSAADEAATGGFLMPLNRNTAMKVTIDDQTGEMKVTQTYLKKEEAGLRDCIEKATKASQEHVKASKYISTWSHAWNASFGEEGPDHGFEAENNAYTNYIRAVQNCRKYGSVNVDGKSARDYLSEQIKSKLPAALSKTIDGTKELNYKLDVFEDVGYLAVATAATWGVGGVLSSIAGATRAAMALETAANLGRFERVAFSVASGINKMKYGNAALRGGMWTYNGLSKAAAASKAGMRSELIMAGALTLTMAPKEFMMNYNLHKDYKRAEELHRLGKFNAEGFGETKEKWLEFKRTVDQNDNDIPDTLDKDMGFQWIAPDAAMADMALSNVINFGAMAGMRPWTHWARHLHLPLFAAGALDRSRAYFHGRINAQEYKNQEWDSMIGLAPGLLAMQIPLASKFMRVGGSRLGLPNLADKVIYPGSRFFLKDRMTLGRFGDALATTYLNHKGHEWALEATGRAAPHPYVKPEDEKKWSDWASWDKWKKWGTSGQWAEDLPTLGQDLYFGYLMSGSGQNNYIRSELRSLNKGNLTQPQIKARLETLRQSYGERGLAGAVNAMSPREIYEAREKNRDLYDLALKTTPGMSDTEFRNILDLHLNGENATYIKLGMNGTGKVDVKKLHKEGAPPKGWFEAMKAGFHKLGDLNNRLFMEGGPFFKGDTLHETLPRLVKEHRDMITRAYRNTGDMQFRQSLNEYMRNNPNLVHGVRLQDLDLNFNVTTESGDKTLPPKQAMDGKLVFEYGSRYKMLTDIQSQKQPKPAEVNLFGWGFVDFATSRAKDERTKYKPLSELIEDYARQYKQPGFKKGLAKKFDTKKGKRTRTREIAESLSDSTPSAASASRPSSSGRTESLGTTGDLNRDQTVKSALAELEALRVNILRDMSPSQRGEINRKMNAVKAKLNEALGDHPYTPSLDADGNMHWSDKSVTESPAGATPERDAIVRNRLLYQQKLNTDLFKEVLADERRDLITEIRNNKKALREAVGDYPYTPTLDADGKLRWIPKGSGNEGGTGSAPVEPNPVPKNNSPTAANPAPERRAPETRRPVETSQTPTEGPSETSNPTNLSGRRVDRVRNLVSRIDRMQADIQKMSGPERNQLNAKINEARQKLKETLGDTTFVPTRDMHGDLVWSKPSNISNDKRMDNTAKALLTNIRKLEAELAKDESPEKQRELNDKLNEQKRRLERVLARTKNPFTPTMDIEGNLHWIPKTTATPTTAASRTPASNPTSTPAESNRNVTPTGLDSAGNETVQGILNEMHALVTRASRAHNEGKKISRRDKQKFDDLRTRLKDALGEHPFVPAVDANGNLHWVPPGPSEGGPKSDVPTKAAYIALPEILEINEALKKRISPEKKRQLLARLANRKSLLENAIGESPFTAVLDSERQIHWVPKGSTTTNTTAARVTQTEPTRPTPPRTPATVAPPPSEPAPPVSRPSATFDPANTNKLKALLIRKTQLEGELKQAEDAGSEPDRAKTLIKLKANKNSIAQITGDYPFEPSLDGENNLQWTPKTTASTPPPTTAPQNPPPAVATNAVPIDPARDEIVVQLLTQIRGLQAQMRKASEENKQTLKDQILDQINARWDTIRETVGSLPFKPSLDPQGNLKWSPKRG